MATLILNPKYDPNTPGSQQYIFADPSTAVVNQSTGQTANTLNANAISDQPSLTTPKTVANSGVVGSIVDSSKSTVPTPQQVVDTQNATDNATVAADKTKIADLTAKNASTLNSLETYNATKATAADLVSRFAAQYQIPTMIDTVNGLITNAKSIQDQINSLNTEEQNAIENTIGQGRGIPDVIISGQQAKIQRQYAIRTNALAATLSSITSTIQAFQGNITLAQKSASDAVQAALYDQEQKVQDYKDLYAYNKDIIDSLSTETKSILDKQYQQAQNDLQTARDEKTQIAQLMVDNPSAGITIGDSLQEAAAKVAKSGGSIAARQETRLENGSSAPSFTSSQQNTGAANAGVDITTFQGLPADVQNLFINNKDTGHHLVDDVSQVQAGSMTSADAIKDIESQNVSPSVKQYFKSLLPADQANAASSGGNGFTDALSWIGQHLGFGSSIIGVGPFGIGGQ